MLRAEWERLSEDAARILLATVFVESIKAPSEDEVKPLLHQYRLPNPRTVRNTRSIFNPKGSRKGQQTMKDANYRSVGPSCKGPIQRQASIAGTINDNNETP